MPTSQLLFYCSSGIYIVGTDCESSYM